MSKQSASFSVDGTKRQAVAIGAFGGGVSRNSIHVKRQSRLEALRLLALDDDEEKGNNESMKVNSDSDRRDAGGASESGSAPCSSSVLESLSNDISALILSHLDLREIASVSLVSRSLYKSCRTNTLWKKLMTYRWNIPSQGGGEQHCEKYFTSYQRAHAHPHDLWISHWNCVYPCDGLSPGRCFICSNDDKSCNEKHTEEEEGAGLVLRCCPNCRDWNDLEEALGNPESSDRTHGVQPTTPAQLMAVATSFTRRKWPSPPDRITRNSNIQTSKARRAFACAGTFHRKLSIDQYQLGPCSFLTDLLFFNLTDPATEEGQWELQQLLREAQDGQNEEEDERETTGVAVPADLSLYETSHHSWHVLRLFNPDFYRPILYQIGVQRPDCFSVYPSEGYIEPGGTVYLTVGVRPLGSALAYAFDALNVQRDGLDVAWSDLYSEEAHLPMNPILVRYQFAPALPSSAHPVHDPRRRPPYGTEGAGDVAMQHRLESDNNNKKKKPKKKDMLDFYWREEPVDAQHIRSIHLSAHVHSHYMFHDFLKTTCHPWDVRRDSCGPLYVSPVLREVYPTVYEKLQDVPDESHSQLQIVPSHTEGPCVHCRRPWGVREEELAQAYMVCQTEIAEHFERRVVLLENMHQCVHLLNSGLSGQPPKFSDLLVTVTHLLQCLKASPLTSSRQKQLVLQLEAAVDDAFRQIPVGGEDWVPWRLAGIYRFALCTDSVFQGQVLEDGTINADFKDEPDYLDAFRHLTHSPGRYCLGPQEDPNHLGETSVSSSPRYARIQKGIATDVFMDDPISAFQAGICMMRDPRSMLVHGIYDHIPYPGSVVRRPKLHCCFKPSGGIKRRKTHTPIEETEMLPLLKARHKFITLQNGLDLDAVIAAERFAGEEGETSSTAPNHSLENYRGGVPPPGVGRFSLSQELPPKSEGNTSTSSRIAALELEDEGGDSLERPSGVEQAGSTRNNARPEDRPDRPLIAGNLRGPPRLLHLLWVLGAQLGLAVIDTPGVASVFVDRTILIASQWVSISLMAAPLFWTLCARYAQLIPAQPVDYNLEDLPFSVSNKMRFLTDRECGYVAVVVLFVWLALGRWTERHVHRDFFRVMLEHITPSPARTVKMTRMRQLVARLSLWFMRLYDAFCPLFLQRRVFAPHWNRRTRNEIFSHIAFWRSRNLNRPPVARPALRRGDFLFGDSCLDEGVNVGVVSTTVKVAVGLLVAMGSFCSSSPHFWLNLVTVFSCSISLGMSVSLHSMEKGRSTVSMNNTGSIIKAASLATVVILAFLVGQLIGSSGGTMFLAEFIVTSISLILGGAGTISASAMESWGCFFCLSTTAFWGYLFGRVALLDGIREKRGGSSSILLSKAVIFLFFFWVLVFLVSRWDGPVSLMIVRTRVAKDSSVPNEKLAINLLQ